MSSHFNGLTPAEAERLAMLAEEAGEIVLAIGKVLRHGYESRHPDCYDSNGSVLPGCEKATNREALRMEICDFSAVYNLCLADDLGHTYREAKEAMERKLRYSHHQKKG